MTTAKKMTPTLYRKKPIPVACHQWFRNGDHPDDFSDRDNSDGMPQREGMVVRHYRHPSMDGQSPCKHCGKIMHDHGWIDTLEGGHIVCPGDWVITGVRGERYPCKPDIFAATYEPTGAHPPAAASGAVDEIRRSCQWPTGFFSVRDMPGDHEPTYLVLPDGALISINYHGDPKVNPAQCEFIAKACNAALSTSEAGHDEMAARIKAVEAERDALKKERDAMIRHAAHLGAEGSSVVLDRDSLRSRLASSDKLLGELSAIGRHSVSCYRHQIEVEGDGCICGLAGIQGRISAHLATATTKEGKK